MIVAAAIKFGDAIVSVAQPGRHPAILRAAMELGVALQPLSKGVYGFLTDEGAFLTRAEAAVHVLECKQPLLCTTIHQLGLFSEDLW